MEKNHNSTLKGWQQERFNSHVSLQYGSSLPEAKRKDGTVPVYGSNGQVGVHSKPLIKGPGIIVGRKGTIGAVTWSETDFWPIDTTYYVEHDESVDLRWLYYELQSLGLERMNTASGTPGLNREEVYKLKVSVPPYTEQKKIAEVLGAVDEEIQKTDEIIAATEKLKRGLMQNIFSFRNDESVKYLALGDIGKVSMCKRIFKEETSSNGEIPFYKIGTFGKEPDSFISKELFNNYRNKFSFPKIGDVLLSASGTIGRKVKYDGKQAYFQDSNIIWLEHDESRILNDFLYYLYDTITWQTEGSTIKRLYNNILLKKVVPVPPINKQKQIVEILSAIDKKISLNQQLRAKLTQLKKGLMQDLLSGKVRVGV